MVISVKFLGKEMKVPSGSGMIKEPCPGCGKQSIYCIFGYDEVLKNVKYQSGAHQNLAPTERSHK